MVLIGFPMADTTDILMIDSPRSDYRTPPPADGTGAGNPNATAVLNDLNFDNAQAVREAHAAIANLPALAQWYDRAFQGGEKTGLLACVATLILYQAAETGRQSCAHIPGSREQALASLSPQLSATGKIALLQTLNEPPAANEFGQYFAASDRYTLAGHAYRAEAEAANDRAGHVRAAHTFAKAARAHAQAGPHTLATAAIDAAVALYMQTCEYDDAMALLRSDADDHTLAGRKTEAVAAYAKLGLAYETAAYYRSKQNRHEQAADASLAAAQARQKAGAHEHAARTFMTGARVYTAAKQPELALATYLTAAAASLAVAQAEQEAGQHERAALAFMTGASAYAKARQYSPTKTTYIQAADASLTAAQAHQKAGEHEHAAHTFMMGAQAYAAAKEPEPAPATYMKAADASLAAAQIHQKAGELEHVARTFIMGARAYTAAGQHELAQATYAHAVEVHETLAQAQAQADKPDRAAAAHQASAVLWTEIAKTCQEAKQPHRAGDAFAKAAECYAQAELSRESSDTLKLAMVAYQDAGQHMLAASVAEQYAQVNRAAGRTSLIIAGVVRAARAYAKGERHTLAARTYAEAAELLWQGRRGTDSIRAYQKAASQYQELGQMQEAVNVLRDAARRFSGQASRLEADFMLDEAIESSSIAATLAREASTLAGGEAREKNLFSDALATQKLDEKVIAKIHAALSPHALALQAGGTLHAGRHTLTFGPAKLTGKEAFSPTNIEEWCLLARDSTLTNLDVVRLSVLAKELPPHSLAPNWFMLVPAERLVRGEDALTLLSAVSEPVPPPHVRAAVAAFLT